MAADYRKLVNELFGTDDVPALKKIAEGLNRRNPRGAGRKPKFTQKDIADIKALLYRGVTINEIAERYGTSRQIISKYVNSRPEAGYTLRITYMFRQYPCTVIDVDFLDQQIEITNRTEDIMHRAFGINVSPDWDDFRSFIESRCVPRGRGNLRSVLRGMDIDTYDPLRIAEKTRGRLADDDMWLKFEYYPQSAVLAG